MSDQLISSIVRILSPGGRAAGVGYLASDKHVITCAHMVANALDLPQDAPDMPEGAVLVDFPFRERPARVGARVSLWRKGILLSAYRMEEPQDLAILELDGPPPTQEPPAQEPPEEEAAAGEPPSQEASPPSPAVTLTDDDYEGMILAIKAGEFVPFLGAGVNLCDRPSGLDWKEGGDYLPSGEELSKALAEEFGYPLKDTGDLGRVTQFVALFHTMDKLNEKLRLIFNKDYPPTSVHRFFARLPALLRERRYPPNFLIVTTNYDDLLERAFREEGQEFDLLSYWAGGHKGDGGQLLHWPPGKTRHRVIRVPNEDKEFPLDEDRHLRRPVILKIHGAVDRLTESNRRSLDSFVITEDQYIDFLTRSNLVELVPATLSEKLSGSSFLFLGYSLRDWNLRVILHRIWTQQNSSLNLYKSWAIQLRPGVLEQKFWEPRRVDIFDENLSKYIGRLEERVRALPPAKGER